MHAADLSAAVLTALVERTGLDPAVVDDVFWGCVSQVGEQAGNIARVAALAAGWPESVSGTTIDRQCGSLQQAVAFAAAAVVSGQADGAFDEQTVPVHTSEGGVVTADEGIRAGGTLEKLAALKTPFQADGVISAGNASQISDGSAALLVTTSEKARELGLTPLVRVHTTVVAGDDPVIMLTAPIPATRKLLQRSGVPLGKIGVFEVNRPSPRFPWPGSTTSVQTSTRSTRWAARSRSGIRWAARARGS